MKVVVYLLILSMCGCFLWSFISDNNWGITGATVCMILALFTMNYDQVHYVKNNNITNLTLTNWKRK